MLVLGDGNLLIWEMWVVGQISNSVYSIYKVRLLFIVYI